MSADRLAQVKSLIAAVLQLPGGEAGLAPDTRLLGALPELDSMSVVSLLTALEEHFGFVIADEELHSGMFETVQSLASFVEAKLAVE